ncbi:MAG: dUTP diphosphatase [Candidatus Aureabacteria bacterium]|nr:dUTP diphosphatase [Candidatus Auribacterota bacterium]MCK5654798.1 dUTP diphosphatase [Candidatus Auribacterota bacterium]
MKHIKIKIKVLEHARDLPVPKYMSEEASGMDLYAAVDKDTELKPGEISLIPTGICMSILPGYEAQVRPRSGLSLKHGLSIVNSPGTIDSDYRGEIGIILINLGKEPFVIKRGLRIAQLILQEVIRGDISVVAELAETQRNSGGFGHTGH